VTLPGRLGTLRDHLRPSMWTHVGGAAAGMLIDTIRQGKVE
jgi:hypothetical protein